jgi:hypothetical protein
MNKAQLLVRQAKLALCLAALSSLVIAVPRQEPPQEKSTVIFFDVSDLPARIDEPRLHKSERGFVLDCAIANRSSEQLLGLRLILMVVEPSGKLRSRITWTEGSELAAYSIKTFAFHPPISRDLRDTDQLFLGLDEVIGHETIWRVLEAEKALRAYTRGLNDVTPVVRTVANKFDPRPDVVLVPLEKKQ